MEQTQKRITPPAVDDQGEPLTGDALFDFIYEQAGDTIFLEFSTGKDSICSWLRLREYGRFTIIPYFMYCFPIMSWQREALDYYEDFFDARIVKVAHPAMHKHLRHYLYQHPDNIAVITAMNLQDWDFADLEDELARDYGILDREPFTAVGFRAADNIDRRNMIIQKGAVGTGRRRYFYPVWDWYLDDVVKCIKDYEIALPADYKYWGRTINAWDYQYLKPISEQFPDDFENVIKHWMPLIEAELFRHEVVGEYANGKKENQG